MGGGATPKKPNAAALAAAPLHSWKLLRRAWFNRAFAAVYGITILSLLYHHLRSSTMTSLTLFIADSVLFFMWVTTVGFRVRPIRREAHPENLALAGEDFPAIDVFICTADPDKEPPMGVVNTALSVMAYDYPKEKLSVYVSDDGGSKLTLFAFMEAAKFAAHWLPYCERKKTMERCPDAYFGSGPAWCPETQKIKNMYEEMRRRVESVVERGSIPSDYILREQEHQALNEWRDGFTRQDHPTIIQVLLESRKDRDIIGREMPNLIYLSREKCRGTPHNFKAGALNTLVRVSGTMTNAPIILTLDCDMYANDPTTLLHVLCYFLDHNMDSRLAFLQFPQLFHNINKDDIYSAEFKLEFQINAAGMDGLSGPAYLGTGGFFRRRALFGPPARESPEFSPGEFGTGSLKSDEVLSMARRVSKCSFEVQTEWGYKLGFRYGSLVEDFFTSYMMLCEGWRSISWHPNRPAFLGTAPMTLYDLLSQTKRWFMGFLEVGFSKYSPIYLGFWAMNPFLALCYTHYMYRPLWAIPIIIYTFLPQLALLNSSPVFPKVSDPWFFIYVFLFLGSYMQDLVEFLLEGGRIRRWWNSQRIWVIRGLSSFTFALGEMSLKSVGLATVNFNVTSKVIDDELRKRYDQGIYEFGVASPLFLPLTMGAMINLLSFISGICQVLRNGSMDGLFLQLFIAGLMVMISWPVYEAMVFRTDKGKMPLKITMTSIVLVSFIYKTSTLAF